MNKSLFLILSSILIILNFEQPKNLYYLIKNIKGSKLNIESSKLLNQFKNSYIIQNHNNNCLNTSCSYQLGHNNFSTISIDQFKLKYLSNFHQRDQTKPRKTSTPPHPTIVTPSSFSWVDEGKVSPVKNQGECGACQAFSATGAVESAWAIKHDTIQSLSEQQYIDCEQSNRGCHGGIQPNLFVYSESHLIETEKEQPYIQDKDDSNHSCKQSSSEGKVKISDQREIDQGKEDEMLQILYKQGPVSADMDALGDGTFQFYKKGVFQSDKCSKDNTNHAVLIVGQGEENGDKQWLVKNSFGQQWGDEGQFKILRGENMCGIATYNSQPII